MPKQTMGEVIMGYSFRVNMFLLKVWSEAKEGAEGTAVCVRKRR